MPGPIKMLADASLPELARLFQTPFVITPYHSQQQVADLLPHHDILLCRSTLRVDANLLANSTIQCVATASSGTDHIDNVYLRQHHIKLFDAKGSNARAVADYVVSTLAVHQPIGKLAGVIGVGEVGSRVIDRLHAAGFKVLYYDPIKAQQNMNYPYCTLAELTACDLLCIHANLHDTPPFPSKHLLNADFLTQLKPNVTLINASRGGIVDENALLNMTTPITYCTDVYNNEPSIDPRIIDFATVCTPHIAGHSIEAKQAAVVQVSQQLYHYYGLEIPSYTVDTMTKANLSISKDTDQPTPSKDTDQPTLRGLSAESRIRIGTGSREQVAGRSGQNGGQDSKKHWKNCVLSRYNPLVETHLLKAALDKKAAFLSQRKAHQFRHDFNRYYANEFDHQTKLLFGMTLDS